MRGPTYRMTMLTADATPANPKNGAYGGQSSILYVGSVARSWWAGWQGAEMEDGGQVARGRLNLRGRVDVDCEEPKMQRTFFFLPHS